MNQADVVLFKVDAQIATVTLNRPERRNALTIAVANRLYEMWEEIDGRDDIRAVILRGVASKKRSAPISLISPKG